jgi:4-amino-4-deoxy-L-arabinose transferase-like glycosyltransferase
MLDSTPLNDISQSSPTLRLVAAITAALAIPICLFGHLGAMGLVGPDEPRYAWIARNMATSGDGVTPRLYGQPWFEKPILYYWLGAIGFHLKLPAEWAARLPSAFAALAAAFAIAWLAWKHYGIENQIADSPALLAPLIFSTSVAAVGFARAATPDMLFSACITLAMAGAAGVLRLARTPRRSSEDSDGASDHNLMALLLFGGSLGLSVLAKGPAGVILVAGAIGIWALATGSWRAAFRLAHPWALAAFCVIGLPWYVLCARRNPDFLHAFIFQHNFERYLTPMFQHKQPFWFLGAMTLLALLPWTVLMIPAAQEGLQLWREKSWRESPGFFVACWAVFPIVFFTFSESKLPGYILPAIPPLAFLLAVTCKRFANPHSASYSWITTALALTWAATGFSPRFLNHRLPPGAQDAVGQTILLCAALAVASALIIKALRLLDRRGALLLSALLVAVLVEIAGARILPELDPYISARPHAQLLLNDRRPERIFTYRLNRSWNYGLAFYLGRELPEWSPKDPQAALVLTNPKGLQEIRKLGRLGGELDESYQGILYVPVTTTVPSSH